MLTMFLTSCAETVAFLGPTGRSSIEHAIGLAEKHNPERKKVKCVSFLEVTESEVCSILKKRVSELKSQIYESSKIKILD